MNCTNRLNTTVWLIPIVMVVTSCAKVDASISDSTMGWLTTHLTSEQARETLQTLERVEQRTLGPQPLTEKEQRILRGPAQTIRLDPAQVARKHDLRGRGTAEEPYRDFIARFLEDLGEQEVTVLVPAGHYEELGVDVPEGVWLRPEGGRVVLQAPAERPGDRPGYLISLVSNSGLVGFVLDGSRMPFARRDGEWRGQPMRMPAERLNGVVLRRRAQDRGPRESNIVLAGNHIHHFSGDGISAQRLRRRWGATDVMVMNNRVENIGYAGISVGGGWTVRNNVVHYAGILRPDGGGGHDGIIASWVNNYEGESGETQIVNNTVIMSRRMTGYGRHGIATHVSHDITVAGNLVILEGPVRGGLRFSDWSHRNRIVGNVIIGLVTEDGALTPAGIGISGQGNEVLGNVAIGTLYFININNRAADALRRTDEDPGRNVLRYNYSEAREGDAISGRGPDRNTVKENRLLKITHMPTAESLPVVNLPSLWYGEDENETD